MSLAVRIACTPGEFTLEVEFESSSPAVGVLGPSGAGKTTLLHAIAGLRRPEAGRIAIGGRVLFDSESGVNVRPERRRVGLVSQTPLLFPHRSVRANLTWAPGARRLIATERGREIVEVLRLGGLLERGVRDLSGGEAQRVALGRALLAAPELLLLDEPTAALDGRLAREVLQLCRRVADELYVPMLFVTHRIDEVLSLASECLALDAGRIVARGAPLEVLGRTGAGAPVSLVGVDNLLRLPVLAHEPEGGTSVVDLGAGVELRVPLCEAARGSYVDVGLHADEVLLSLEAPRGVSARNVLPARVQRLDGVGHEVLVRLLVGRALLFARITPAAVRELDLREGVELSVLIKTSACRLIG